MGRRLLVTGLLVAWLLVVSEPAGAATRALWPGVTYSSSVELTTAGPVVVNVLTGPRPGGSTSLAPLLSNETLTGRETLTQMEQRTAAQGASAGVNGDFFTLSSGLPSGILMRDGEIASPPSDGRSSAGILTDGTLDVRRVGFAGTWQGAGARRILTQFNRSFPGAGIVLYTSSWGAETPAVKGATTVTLFPYPAAVPNSDLTAPVVASSLTSGSVPIPPGGAVLVARGAQAAALRTDAPVDQLVTTRLLFKPDWPDVVQAVGGGPQIVRDGQVIFKANELFATGQISPRSARSAVGQLADGQIVLVAVDGLQPGYSIGVSNFELGRLLQRLGAVTAMALDSGGSTTMAFNGSLLNKPSDRVERPISTGLVFRYSGVFVEPAVAVVSPDGDGYRDRQTLRYRLVRPSTVQVTLTGPDGAVAIDETSTKDAGLFGVPFPPTPAAALPAGRGTSDRATDPPAQGRWTLKVSATDDVGQTTSMSQRFVVNSTAGFLSTLPGKLYLPPYGRDVEIRWRQTRPARVVLTVETTDGVVLRTLARRTYQPGAQAVVWNGLDRTGRAVHGGKVVVHVVARNGLGTVELTRFLRVQRIVGARG
jgi:hypothetical protein